MYNNIENLVTVSSSDKEQNNINVVPNFLFINKPVVKVSGNKTTRTKKLIIWFDLRGNQMPLDVWSLPPKIYLENFEWQLILVNDEGTNKLVKPIDGNKEISKDKLIITRDANGLDINPTNTIVYELDEKEFGGDLKFQYNLKYKNNQRIGLNYQIPYGGNTGFINIKQDTNPLVVNNAFAYMENSKQHFEILNKEELIVKKRQLNEIDDLKTPILELCNKYEQRTNAQIMKSAQLRGELARLSNNGISYLKTNEKGFKTVKNGDSFSVYKEKGNNYDFQTNKWVDDALDQTYSFNDSKLKINFEFNHRNLDFEWDIKALDLNLKTSKKSNKELTKYATYKNIKPNTKFETFLKARDLKLWE